MAVEANTRCVRCVTKVVMGVTFCDDCHETVKKFNDRKICWHCASDHECLPVMYFCGNCGVEVAQTVAVCAT